jgi:hypothetical protein
MNSKLLSNLKEYWFMIAFIVGVIVTWANLQNADATSLKRIDVLEQRMGTLQTIEVQLSQIQTDLIWIRKSLDAKGNLTH